MISVLDAIAVVFGILGVILTIKQNMLCWPTALISVIASTIAFYNQRLFGDMSLQVFYFFAGIYGWIYWKRETNEKLKVKRMLLTEIPVLLIATILQSALYYVLLINFKGDMPLFDAVLTACSLTATYMMTKKWLENWLFWVIIDLAYAELYIIKQMWWFAILYLVFGVIAYFGWLKWRKEAY